MRDGTAEGISGDLLAGHRFNDFRACLLYTSGTLTYEQQKTGTDNYDLIVICIQEVDELLVEINEINARISEIKDGVVCARCHTCLLYTSRCV